ncbi:ADP-ribosyltransferase exoenzyme [Nitzschia inconspicua]|uniref:ADP-ribosyltransferase exoenzyme n=1 Tax=Nitzschia inconspicua TaxID=303405 RepID=A0A9K3PPM6_9STRA|nr:ADP-ribosyltransferase exoenzyme [Nitzschia inconspicua]
MGSEGSSPKIDTGASSLSVAGSGSHNEGDVINGVGTFLQKHDSNMNDSEHCDDQTAREQDKPSLYRKEGGFRSHQGAKTVEGSWGLKLDLLVGVRESRHSKATMPDLCDNDSDDDKKNEAGALSVGTVLPFLAERDERVARALDWSLVDLHSKYTHTKSSFPDYSTSDDEDDEVGYGPKEEESELSRYGEDSDDNKKNEANALTVGTVLPFLTERDERVARALDWSLVDLHSKYTHTRSSFPDYSTSDDEDDEVGYGPKEEESELSRYGEDSDDNKKNEANALSVGTVLPFLTERDERVARALDWSLVDLHSKYTHTKSSFPDYSTSDDEDDEVGYGPKEEESELSRYGEDSDDNKKNEANALSVGTVQPLLAVDAEEDGVLVSVTEDSNIDVSGDQVLSMQESEAIHAYTMDYTDDFSFGPINAALRAKASEGVPLEACLDERVQILMSGLAKLPTFTPQDCLWRGTRPDVENYFDLQPGKIFCDPAFLSTSKDEEAAEEFGFTGFLFAITNKKQGKDISHISNAPEEAEVLFPPSTKFEITRREDRIIWMTEVVEEPVDDWIDGDGVVAVESLRSARRRAPKVAVMEYGLGTVYVDGRRRSARHQKPMGSVFDGNGIRRSARLQQQQ